MNISVGPSSADDNYIPSIEALLKDTASHLNKYLSTPFNGTIEVRIAPNEPKAPITLNRNCRDDPIRVLLSPNPPKDGLGDSR